MPRTLILIWTWTPALVAVLALLGATYVGLVEGAWPSAEHLALIGVLAAAASAVSYLLFWRRRNSS
jgi:NADH:ubiquinone oxidoreductase subunit H